MRLSSSFVLIGHLAVAPVPSADGADFAPEYLKSLPFIDTAGLNAGFCWEIYPWSNDILTYYREKGETDSVSMFLRFVSQHCGGTYAYPNVRILDQIAAGTFSEDSIPSTFFLHYLRYLPRLRQKRREESFIEVFSDSLSRDLDTTSVDYLFTLYFAGNRTKFFDKLQHGPAFANTRVKRLYDREVRFARRTTDNRPFGSLALTAAPGNSSRGRLQPDIGISVGRRIGSLFCDIHGSIGIDPRRAHSEVLSGGAYHEVEPEFDVNVGCDIGYAFGSEHAYHLDFILGLHCNVESLGATAANDSTTWTKASFSPSPGIGYRFYLFGGRVLLSPQLRYWFVNHDRIRYKGKEVDYHAVGLRILVGASDRYREHRMLEALGALPIHRAMD